MFNLFEKRINEVSLEELEELKARQIAEGFFIEYKSDFQEPLKIARSIASFANTYGGWYFVGIVANERNTPKDLPGFDLSANPRPLEHIRNVIKDYVDPFPRYYSKLVELENGKAILIVEIPESDETPHITKNGRIYRRNAEGSDPMVETNRYALDRLYEKSEASVEAIERFCRREIVLSEYEKNQAWIEIYLMPYPIDRMNIEAFIDEEFVDGIKERMNEQTKIEFKDNFYVSMGIPMNVISASTGSIILRQATIESLPFMGLTFELFNNGNAKIIIPFEYLRWDAELDSAAWTMLISNLEDKYLLRDLYRIINGWKFLNIFLTIMQKYIDFLKSQRWEDEILIAYKIENTWRTILFFDSESMAEHVRKYGVPLCQRENTRIPRNLTKDKMIRKMPEDSLFQIIEFAKISTHFGFFPHEWGALIRDWLKLIRSQSKSSGA